MSRHGREIYRRMIVTKLAESSCIMMHSPEESLQNRLAPWFGLVPWLAPSALRFLHRLAATVAKQSAPDAPSAWGAHFHAVTVSLAAPLLHTACTASWQLHAACGELL